MGQQLSTLLPPPPDELRCDESVVRGKYITRGAWGRKLVAVKKFNERLLSSVAKHRDRRELETLALSFKREYEFLERAKNPHIVEHLGLYGGLRREGGALLVLEWMEQSLETFLEDSGRLPRWKKMDICHQVLVSTGHSMCACVHHS